MQTITTTIDLLTAWVQKNICDPVKMKAPPDDLDEANGAGYAYSLVTPTAFPLYVPSREKLPPKVTTTIPAVLVRFLEGEDRQQTGTMNFDLCFCAWNPGTHGNDILLKTGVDPITYRVWEGSEAERYFTQNTDGWRDLWNWIDTAVRALHNTATIDGMKLAKSPIRYAPFTPDENQQDTYPFWYAYISFALERPVIRNVKEYDEYL